MHVAVSFSSHQFLATWLGCYFAFEIRDFPLESGFCSQMSTCYFTLSISFILLILFILRVRKIILSLRLRTPPDTDLLGVDLKPPCLIVALTGTQVLPKDGANCRDTNCGPCLIGMGDWPNAPCTMNL